MQLLQMFFGLSENKWYIFKKCMNNKKITDFFKSKNKKVILNTSTDKEIAELSEDLNIKASVSKIYK